MTNWNWIKFGAGFLLFVQRVSELCRIYVKRSVVGRRSTEWRSVDRYDAVMHNVTPKTDQFMARPKQKIYEKETKNIKKIIATSKSVTSVR